jgi:hypothetical protein
LSLPISSSPQRKNSILAAKTTFGIPEFFNIHA